MTCCQLKNLTKEFFGSGVRGLGKEGRRWTMFNNDTPVSKVNVISDLACKPHFMCY